MKKDEDNLSKIRSPWRRLLISVLLNCLIALGFLLYPNSKGFHWVGNDQSRRRSFDWFIIGFFLSLPALIIADRRDALLWSASAGIAVSVYVIIHTIAIISAQTQN